MCGASGQPPLPHSNICPGGMGMVDGGTLSLAANEAFRKSQSNNNPTWCASDVATKRILLFINNDLGQTIGLVGARCPTH